MDIIIIEGFDNFSDERYIRDVKLSKEEAQKTIQEYKPNGSLPDSYCMTECTLEDLEMRKIKSSFTNETFDDFDIQHVNDILNKTESD
jgi:molybdopterin-guanine dinucleotide biosynthesis protein